MQAPLNPVALPVTVDTTGAKILEGSVAEHDSRDIYLPNHVETVSHIAIDVGGSLAKVVYFTRVARPTTTPSSSIINDPRPHSPLHKHNLQERQPSPPIVGTGIPLGARSPASPASMSSSRIHSRESSANVAQIDQKQSSSIHRQPSRSQLSNHGVPIAHTAEGLAAVPAGTLTPTSLFASPNNVVSASAIHSHFMKRRSLPSQLPGGRLNFVKFETADIMSCVNFLKELINLSAKANNVTLTQMRQGVKLMATGGGAHLFNDLFEEELGVEVRSEDEMQCLITGLNFITLIPDETFYYSDELVDNLSATSPGTQTKRQDPSSAASSSSSLLSPNGAPSPSPQTDLPRPSPDPPLYSPAFDSSPLPKLPCLLVNIGSGVSIIKVDEDGKFERVSGTSLGGGTLWGLLSLLTDAESFDEMLEMASRGDNGTVDMLVSDVYGSSDALSNLGLKSTTIASSFGKVFRKDKGDRESSHRGQAREERSKKFKQEDICKSLLYAISNNIGQIAYMNAEKFGLDRIYFGGCFIRGHQATIATLSYAIRFWSKGTKRAFFLRHEGYLGALGAWIRQFYDGNGVPNTPTNAKAAAQHAFSQLVPNQDASAVNGTTSDSIPTPVKEEPNSNEATPRQTRDGVAARSSAATPAMSRQQSGPAQPKIQTPSANGNSKINSILADALGGANLDDGIDSSDQSEKGQQTAELHDVTVSEKDMAALRTVNQPNGNREDEAKDLLQLVQSLSAEDRELFSQFSELQNSANGSAAEGEDGPSIADLLKNMDYVDGAADGLEGKLDGLLSRLDALLQDVEEEEE